MTIVFKQRKTKYISKNKLSIPYYRVNLFIQNDSEKHDWFIVEKDFIYKELKTSRSKAVEFVKNLGKARENCKTENKGRISFPYKGDPLVSIVLVHGLRTKTIIGKNNFFDLAKILGMQDGSIKCPKLLDDVFSS